MLNILAFLAGNELTYIVMIIRIVLCALILVCAGFIVFVVMKQSGNSDGMEAMTGFSKQEDNESFYSKNPGARSEAKLKKWTYICAIALALCAVAMLVMSAVWPTVA